MPMKGQAARSSRIVIPSVPGEVLPVLVHAILASSNVTWRLIGTEHGLVDNGSQGLIISSRVDQCSRITWYNISALLASVL